MLPDLATLRAEASRRGLIPSGTARPQTDAQLKTYLLDTFGVTLPDRQVCDDHSTPFAAFAEAYFARAPLSIWVGSRGFGGKSFALALLGLTEALTLHADVSVLGGSGEQSERVLDAMRKLWSAPNAPRHTLEGEPARQITRFQGGHTIRALMASSKSVRGPHPQRLRLDEGDEMDLAILEAALGQPMATPGVQAQTVISSTHHYAAGTMTEMLRRAGEQGAPVHRWCYRETCVSNGGWLPDTEIATKQAMIPAQMWAAEYELQEPSFEGRAILPEAVTAAWGHGQPLNPGDQPLILHPAVRGARYATGADWARATDYTVIQTYRADVQPMQLVAYQRLNRRPWPLMVGLLEQRIRAYPGAACHDGTGLGDVVAGYLNEPAEPVLLVGRARADLFSEYIGAIERGELRGPRIQGHYEAHLYASVDDLYTSAGHPPDDFVAGALAYRAATVRTGVGVAGLPAFMR